MIGGPLTADDVIARLEEAGRTLLAMSVRAPGPGVLTAQSQRWPVVHDTAEAYGYHCARARPAIPASAAISRMDEALGWIGMIPQERWVVRRIVGARCLVAPLTGRHIYTWTRVARLIGCDVRAVRSWHRQGIALIVAALAMRGAA